MTVGSIERKSSQKQKKALEQIAGIGKRTTGITSLQKQDNHIQSRYPLGPGISRRANAMGGLFLLHTNQGNAGGRAVSWKKEERGGQWESTRYEKDE